MVPEVDSRTRLLEFMTRHGQTISVHGMDTWFKHTDSNCVIERESLDPEHPSYALPKARWDVLFKLFKVAPEQIGLDDADSRRWCYSQAGNRRQPPAVRQSRVACCFHPRDQACLTDDRTRFANEKIELVELSGPSHPSDGSVMRSLKDVDVGVVYLSSRIADRSLLAELRDVPQQAQTPAIGISIGGYVVKEFSFPRFPHGKLDHRQAMISLLKKEVAPSQTAIRSGLAWSPPELYTARPSIAVLLFANFTGNDEYNELAEAIAICAQLEPGIRLSDIQLGATLKSTPAWRTSQERLVEFTLVVTGGRLPIAAGFASDESGALAEPNADSELEEFKRCHQTGQTCSDDDHGVVLRLTHANGSPDDWRVRQNCSPALAFVHSIRGAGTYADVPYFI